MNVIFFILLLLAAVCFLAAALNVTARVNLVALGLLLAILPALIKAGEALH